VTSWRPPSAVDVGEEAPSIEAIRRTDERGLDAAVDGPAVSKQAFDSMLLQLAQIKTSLDSQADKLQPLDMLREAANGMTEKQSKNPLKFMRKRFSTSTPPNSPRM